MKKLVIVTFIYLALGILYAVGYVKCIIKAVNCDWEPSYKAEVIYTGSIFLGVGGIVGWFDIADEKVTETN